MAYSVTDDEAPVISGQELLGVAKPFPTAIDYIVSDADRALLAATVEEFLAENPG